MADILGEEEIKRLIKEEKVLPLDHMKKLKPKAKSNKKFEERELRISGGEGDLFSILVRKNRIDPFDFSIILRYHKQDGSSYNLRRYNGKHSHLNPLENNKFRGFHIHKATQRYQENGYKIETYAEQTVTYSSLDEAFQVFLKDLNCRTEQPPNTSDIYSFGGE